MSHPEFGYFCPAPRLRRGFRVAFVASVFGVFIGSLTVLALSTGTHNPDQESATLISDRQKPQQHAWSGSRTRVALNRPSKLPLLAGSSATRWVLGQPIA
jgi:hypothetical protein